MRRFFKQLYQLGARSGNNTWQMTSCTADECHWFIAVCFLSVPIISISFAILYVSSHPKTRYRKPYAATQHLTLLMMGVCNRNMSILEHINKITQLHQVGISIYFIRKMYGQTTLKIIFIVKLWLVPHLLVLKNVFPNDDI